MPPFDRKERLFQRRSFLCTKIYKFCVHMLDKLRIVYIMYIYS